MAGNEITMNPIITYITVDLTANNNFDYVRAVQGDTQSRYVHITLLDSQKPYSLSNVEAVLRGTKTDGLPIFNHCGISDNNEIIVELTSQLLASSGIGKYEIALYSINNENDVLTSFPFNVYVSPASFDPKAITSTGEFTELANVIKNIEVINQNVSDAMTASDNAKTSASNALKSEETALEYANESKTSATQSENFSKLSQSWAEGNTGTRDGEDSNNSKYHSEQSSIFAMNAKKSEINAASSETTSIEKSNEASASASTATQKASDASNSAQESKSYAIGTNNTFRENDMVDNSKYYYEQIKGISEGLNGAILPMGTITFSQLQNQSKVSGYMYNISDSFVTDETFKEGAGYTYSAGTNVYYTADGYWDCLAGIPVTRSSIGLENAVIEIISNEEPESQEIGDYWLFEYE